MASITSARRPRTIEELKQWYADHNLPSEEVTLFHWKEHH